MTPTAATRRNGESQQCTATVSNAVDTSAPWSYSPQAGTLDLGTGLYSAPASITQAETVTIATTSVEGLLISDSADVTRRARPYTVRPIAGFCSPGRVGQ